VFITNKESVKKPMGTKRFVQIEINAVFTSTSGKMQFRSGVFDHLNLNNLSRVFKGWFSKGRHPPLKPMNVTLYVVDNSKGPIKSCLLCCAYSVLDPRTIKPPAVTD
jgi:hypothetical protein